MRRLKAHEQENYQVVVERAWPVSNMRVRVPRLLYLAPKIGFSLLYWKIRLAPLFSKVRAIRARVNW